jgi:hypothetical protein
VFDDLPHGEVWIPTGSGCFFGFHSSGLADWPDPAPQLDGSKRIKGGKKASIASVLTISYHNILIHSGLHSVDKPDIIRFCGEAQAVMGT